MTSPNEYRGHRANLLGMIREARQLQITARQQDNGEAKRHLAEVIHGSQLHLVALRAERREERAAAAQLRASVMVEVHGGRAQALAMARALAAIGGCEAQLYLAVVAVLQKVA